MNGYGPETVLGHCIRYKKERQPSNNINPDDWFNHFQSVLEKEIDTDEEDIFQDGEESFLNRPISIKEEKKKEKEVLIAVSKLKPYNYRRISLCGVSNNLYSSVINSRLQELIKLMLLVNGKFFSFSKDYSTADHMFTLLAAIQKQLSTNCKLYVAFIDFEKAFHSVSRNILWPVL